SAVRVDRLRERQIRRVVAADDRAGGLRLHDGLERRERLLEHAPAVVLARVLERREAAREIQRGAPTLARLLMGVTGHTVTVCKTRQLRNGVGHLFSRKRCLTPFEKKWCLTPF